MSLGDIHETWDVYDTQESLREQTECPVQNAPFITSGYTFDEVSNVSDSMWDVITKAIGDKPPVGSR